MRTDGRGERTIIIILRHANVFTMLLLQCDSDAGGRAGVRVTSNQRCVIVESDTLPSFLGIAHAASNQS